jgi:glucose-6-phosphate 1-dehydrogenase
MSSDTLLRVQGTPEAGTAPRGDPCVLVLFGASGDLTKRLLVPALYNLACDGLLPKPFAVLGFAKDDLSDDAFRRSLHQNSLAHLTRKPVNESVWESLLACFHYQRGEFDNAEDYARLAGRVRALEGQHATGGNRLFYLATPPTFFGVISERLADTDLRDGEGWKRLVVEKPFGKSFDSARALNRQLLKVWQEDQTYRIDHYLGKETVQNLLVFRFSNGMFEPLWNKDRIDHIQFTVSEELGVEGRGGYYDQTGAVRDMIQNHMFQMLAYLCMEPPASFRPDAIRNEKAKLLDAVRVLKPEEVAGHAVRGQYGPGKRPDGTPAVGYREEPDVDPTSRTETFAALKLFIDNWRWEGVPIYLRSGKRLWKRGAEIVVQFRRAPEVIFRGTPAEGHLEPNRLVFHLQPDQGIELRFHAKTPGLATHLQKVRMRFDYSEAFNAPKGNGYEVLLYNAMCGDATLFSRDDLVESAWRIAQPILDVWHSSPEDVPTYPAGSWGPKAASDLLAKDNRRWVEVISGSVLERVPLFQGQDKVCLDNLAMMLRPRTCSAGEIFIREGEMGQEMYFICRGEVEVRNRAGTVDLIRREGEFVGELSLVQKQTRNASVCARTPCDLFVLDKKDFDRVRQEHPRFADSLEEAIRRRYQPADTGSV